MRPVLLSSFASLALLACSEPAVDRAAPPESGSGTSDANAAPPVVDATAFDRADEVDAGVLVPATYACDLRGCDAGRDGGTCALLGSDCSCNIPEGCTGGSGLSIAICPYQYRYCVGLAACVTAARYYSRCPY